MTSTPSPLHPLTRLLAFASLLVLGLSLAACGGGGGSGGGGGGGSTTYTISGSVSGASSVTVALSGAATASTSTDAGGNYAFAGLANGSYTVTPSATGYTFTPASAAVTVSGANVMSGTTFTATVAPATYAISGTIGGAVASGVTLTLGGGGGGTTLSGSGGAYALANLAPGTYTVTPSLAGYTFSPASLSVTIGSTNVTGQDFTASALASTYTISGAVSGAVLQGVTISATGAANQSTTTAADGSYTLSALGDGTYTLTPSLAGYTFSPVSLSATVANANLTGMDFTASANQAPTYSLSGTLSGPWVEKVQVTLSGAAGGSTLTDASGHYGFTGLLAGSYTVTPALPGYSYSPSAPTLAVSANTTQDFAATSAFASSAITGTITYAGSKTGRVFVRVYDSCCPGQSAIAGTSVAQLTAGGRFGMYTIRGLGAQSYIVRAEMDTLASGQSNVVNPGYTSGTVTLSGASTTLNLTLTDPHTSAPIAPSAISVYPSNGGAILFYSPGLAAGGQELASSYTVTWGTDTNASNGGTKSFNAVGSNQAVLFLGGLAFGNTYFKVTATIGATTSAPTAVVGPIAIGPTSGANTISGTVTFPGTATGPLHVAIYSPTTGAVYFMTIASPVSPQGYGVSGVPNGSYATVAVLDQNNNGLIDAGDVSNAGGSAPTLTVSSDATANIVLSGASATPQVTTSYGSDGSNANYGIKSRVQDGIKRVVSSVLYSAPTVTVPRDLPLGSGNETYMSVMSVAAPSTADVYSYRLIYSDGSTQDLSARLAPPILGPSALPTNLLVSSAAPNSATVPQFQWSAPATPPSSYEYFISVNPATGGQIWYYPNRGQGLPSTQLDVVFNVDGSASQSSLTTGTGYKWFVVVSDPASRNQAVLQAPTYTP